MRYTLVFCQMQRIITKNNMQVQELEPLTVLLMKMVYWTLIRPYH